MATVTVRRTEVTRMPGTVTDGNFMATDRYPRDLRARFPQDPACSAPGEFRFALLDEGGGALDPVVRGEQTREKLALPRQTRRKIHAQAAVDRLLRGAQRQGRAVQVRPQQLDRRRVHVS